MTMLEEIRKEQKSQRELLENIYQLLARPGTSGAKPGTLAIKLAARKMLEETRRAGALKRPLRLVKEVKNGRG